MANLVAELGIIIMAKSLKAFRSKSMKLRLLTLLCCMSFTLMASAQASGGQIVRKKYNNSTNKSNHNSRRDNKVYQRINNNRPNNYDLSIVNEDEKCKIINLFNNYLTALCNRDEKSLKITLTPILDSFLHKENATISDVTRYLHKIHEQNVVGMSFINKNDWTIRKEYHKGYLDYAVEFTYVLNIKKSNNYNSEIDTYIMHAKVTQEFKIKELNIKRFVNDNEITGETHIMDLTTSKGCYEEAKKIRIYGDGYKAISLYQKAFSIGDAPYRLWALCQIGRIYYQGLGGVNQNFELAFSFFKQASDMGCLPATYYVGICYEYGRGVGQNKNVAEQYYTKSGYKSLPSLDF